MADPPAHADGIAYILHLDRYALPRDFGGELLGGLSSQRKTPHSPAVGVEVDHRGDMTQEEQCLVSPGGQPFVHVGCGERLLGERDTEDRPFVAAQLGGKKTRWSQAQTRFADP